MVNDFLTAAIVSRSAGECPVPRHRLLGRNCTGRAQRNYRDGANMPAVPVASSRTASSRLDSFGRQR